MHTARQPRPTRPLPAPADPRLRVGDAERTQVIDQLADHHAAGRLSLPEFEERMAAAWTAQTGADLEPLTRDLPAPRPPDRPRRPPAARPRLDDQTRTYLAVMALLWLIWLLSGAGYPWPIWPTLGWGIGVAGHLGRTWAGH
jgi:Domain of unknown function (DUF1707)/2TM domain